MCTVYPDYYNNFKCTAGKCKHNCCIGWEIDIDPYTAQYYKDLRCEFGEYVRSKIDWNDTPHFKLAEADRCPMLNNNNLCNIMLELGEDSVCEICAEHPRFYNELDTHTECGLGLSCEAACNIIIGKKDTVKLIGYTDLIKHSSIIKERDRIISILQNRNKNIQDRITDALKVYNINQMEIDVLLWADQLLKLELLDEHWTDVLHLLKSSYKNCDLNDFNSFIEDRSSEYEQLVVYFVYRYFVQSDYSPASIVLFSSFAYYLIYAIGAAIYSERKVFSYNDQLEIIRMFSSEIEYSIDNFISVVNSLENAF